MIKDAILFVLVFLLWIIYLSWMGSVERRLNTLENETEEFKRLGRSKTAKSERV